MQESDGREHFVGFGISIAQMKIRLIKTTNRFVDLRLASVSLHYYSRVPGGG